VTGGVAEACTRSSVQLGQSGGGRRGVERCVCREVRCKGEQEAEGEGGVPHPRRRAYQRAHDLWVHELQNSGHELVAASSGAHDLWEFRISHTRAMRSSVLLAACVAVVCAGRAAAFAPQLSAAPRLRGAAPAVCAAKATAADGWKPAAVLANSLLAASLILSPAPTVFNGPDASFGGAAHAQGATSSKLTKGAPSADANKDPESILRLSLPINEKSPIREAANEIELKMDKALREVRILSPIRGWPAPAGKDIPASADAGLWGCWRIPH